MRRRYPADPGADNVHRLLAVRGSSGSLGLPAGAAFPLALRAGHLHLGVAAFASKAVTPTPARSQRRTSHLARRRRGCDRSEVGGDPRWRLQALDREFLAYRGVVSRDVARDSSRKASWGDMSTMNPCGVTGNCYGWRDSSS